jgi:hypothetical protein
MSTPADYFARIAGNVNLTLLQNKLVIVVGVGTVGSQIAQELAKCGVGCFRFIDGDHLEEANRSRHVLPAKYVGRNKAEAMALHITDEVPYSRASAVPRNVDAAITDSQLDALLRGADLIIAATDDRPAQRRIGQRALALSIPALFPALYGDGGGEVIVQIDPRFPCFFCWDGFRNNEAQLRGVNALNATVLPIIHTAIRLSLGILDPNSEHRTLMATGLNRPPNQVFQHQGSPALRAGQLTRRRDCPACGVGPAGRPSHARSSSARRPPVRPASRPIRPNRSSSFLAMLLYKIVVFLLTVAFAGAPVGIMYFVAPAENAHGNIILGLVSIACGFWLLGGAVAVVWGLVFLLFSWD